MRHQGRLTVWKDDRGFGFITSDGGGEQVFVHVTAFAEGGPRPSGGERVSYELRTDQRGRPQAAEVRLVGAARVASLLRRPDTAPLLLALFFLAAVGVAALTGWLPGAVLLLYLAASAITFVVYALDKSAARKDRWRTRESTLHLLSLVGGWPGALAAQRLLRHKSVKPSFRVAYWATVVVNVLAIGWLGAGGAATP